MSIVQVFGPVLENDLSLPLQTLRLDASLSKDPAVRDTSLVSAISAGLGIGVDLGVVGS